MDDTSKTSNPEPEIPTEGRLLSIDFGAKRLGFAVCTPEQTMCSPVENYTRRTPDLDAKKIQDLVRDYRVVGCVVGLPVHMSGSEGGKARESRTFGEWVAKITNLPLVFADERFTTAWAETQLLSVDMTREKRGQRRDMLAAMQILQGFLDRRKEGSAAFPNLRRGDATSIG